MHDTAFLRTVKETRPCKLSDPGRSACWRPLPPTHRERFTNLKPAYFLLCRYINNDYNVPQLIPERRIIRKSTTTSHNLATVADV